MSLECYWKLTIGKTETHLGWSRLTFCSFPPAHPYRLHWSFYCMSQPPNTHSLLLGSFELNIPSRCKFPGGEAQDSSVHFLDLQLAHFRKQVSIWSYSTSICVYQFFFQLCEMERIDTNIRSWRMREAVVGWNRSPAITHSKPGWKLEPWLWHRTPTCRGCSEPDFSARARGRSCRKRVFRDSQTTQPKT